MEWNSLSITWVLRQMTYITPLFPGNHTSVDRKMTISMDDVRILNSVDNAFFTDPGHAVHMLAELKSK